MHYLLILTIIWITAVAEDVALWVPECGDTVEMLGPQRESVFKSLNKNVSDINLIYAFSTYTVPISGPLPALFGWTTTSGRTRLIKAVTGSRVVTCESEPTVVTSTSGGDTTASTSAGFRSSSNGYPPVIPALTSTPTSTMNRDPPDTTLPSSTPTDWLIKSCYSDGGAITNSMEVIRAALNFCDSAYSCETSLMPRGSYATTTTQRSNTISLGIYNEACEGLVEALSRESSPSGDLYYHIHNRAVSSCLGRMTSIWRECKFRSIVLEIMLRSRASEADPRSAGSTSARNGGGGGIAAVGCREFDFRPL